jgi:hypothetical protein
MNYVVTTSIGRRDAEKVFRKEIWHSATPYKLGHPLMWLIETTPGGVQITDLRGKGGEVSENRIHEISHEEINASKEFSLHNGRHAFKVKIEPATIAHPISKQEGDLLKIYRTMGNWVVDSSTLVGQENAYTRYKIGNQTIFEAAWKDSQLHLVSRHSGLLIGKGNIHKQLEANQTLALEKSDVPMLRMHLGNHSWHFGFASSDVINSVASTRKLPLVEISSEKETEWFKKALKAAILGLLAFLVLSWMMPKPQEELVPAQFAKIILTAPKQAVVAAAESAPAAAKAIAQKKVQETAVVQAFRAKALQNAVSNLMRGGMTKLLAQSDFITGHQLNNESRRMFDTQSKTMRATGPEIGDLNKRNVAVNNIGGDGLANGSGKAVGYSKGEHAGVKGQGKGFVSMDVGNASVEEGLTKDEVGEVIHRHLSEVRYCYESAMIRQPDIEGKLVVDFTIGGNGVVKTSEAKSSTLPDPRLDDCILRRLVTWKFPNTKGGIDVSVSYPFIFKTLGR